MTNLRLFWVIWCCFWAAAWLLAGFITLGLAWLMIPASLLAILIPVGATPQRPQRPQYPAHLGWEPCGSCGATYAEHINGWCPRPRLPNALPRGGGYR